MAQMESLFINSHVLLSNLKQAMTQMESKPVIKSFLFLHSKYSIFLSVPILSVWPLLIARSTILTSTLDIYTTWSSHSWPVSGIYSLALVNYMLSVLSLVTVKVCNASVFPFLMLSANQGNYWYHFYNAFGMTWSLTGNWIRPSKKVRFWDNSGRKTVRV